MLLERIKQFIDYKRIAISAFEKSIGMSNASFGKSLKTGGTIGGDKLENILTTYPEINPVWLMTGKGEMLLEVENPVVEQPQDMSIADKLFALVESQQRDIKTLLAMLKEKDEEISRLREELDARKRGCASNVAPSSNATAV